ncbi:unnamed protein product [Lactuca virosa]|uniref:Uncharacterized protein n=1 Tax=Lactuca virosa TaxID=75947 RepID=A0AAU9MUF6_9ASTR|nr:unnamed protein product [Lactuca virosa]
MDEALTIRVETLERELVDKEKLIAKLKETNARLDGDLGWLLMEGVVKVVDKGIVVGTFGMGTASSTSIRSRVVVENINAFISCDYAIQLHLGELDVEGLRKLNVYDSNDESGISGGMKITSLDNDGGKGKDILG